MSFENYYGQISTVKPHIETVMGAEWKIPKYEEVASLARDYDSLSRALHFGELPGYEYMVHLRHHGFPSPLLDWTASPYVAAYFAFSKAEKRDGKASIYVFNEMPDNMKHGSSDVPRIHRFGPNIRTHRRHFLQQSEYTICVACDRNDLECDWHFEPHENVFARNDPDQDLLWKINIPSSERLKVLKLLDSYNLNAFSLFGSEESLMETLACRELDFRES